MATKARVNPRTTTPTHTISISDGFQNWGLRIDGDYKYIQETPQTPSTIMINQQGGQYGDFDPSMSHIQQSQWVGGRANERFVEDQTRYYDANNMWTSSDGMAHPSLQWRYAIGSYLAQNALQLGKNYYWRSLANNTYSVEFTASASYSAKNLQLWVKKVGTPGTLTVEIRTNSSDKPTSTVVTNATATIAATAFTDEDAHLNTFVFSTAASLTNATVYHVVVYGAATDNLQNHWEVMTSKYSSTAPYSYTSVDRSTWTATTYNMYYRITAAPTTTNKWKFFRLQGTLYGVIIGGKDVYKFESSTDSYGNKSYDDFKTTTIGSGTSGLDKITDVLVVGNIAYFAQGEDAEIRRWEPSKSPAWVDDGTNKGELLCEHTDGGEAKIARYRRTDKTNLTFASIQDWGTDLTFANAVKIPGGEKISSIISYQGKLYVFRPESIWTVDTDQKVAKFNSKIDDAYNATNGRAVIEHGQYLYFSLAKSLEQLYGTTINDVGPHHGAGLPLNRTGFVSNMENAFNQLFVAIDADAGYSSIMLFDGVNYHEVWRAPEAGKSISHLFWYSDKDMAYPYLFFDYGGEVCFIRYPAFGFNPSKDTGIYYVPYSSLTTSTIDMNIVNRPKYFSDVTVTSKNLFNMRTDFTKSADITPDSRILVYYQCDSDIGSDNWNYAGEITSSPIGHVNVNRSNVYSIRLKFRLFTTDANKPPVINATVVEGFARTPIKYQWVIRVKTGTRQATLNGAPDHNPDNLVRWIIEKAQSAEIVTLHSTLKRLDGKLVVIEPPSVQYDFVDPLQKSWGGTVTLVFREA